MKGGAGRRGELIPVPFRFRRSLILVGAAGLLLTPAALAAVPALVGPSTGMMPDGRVLQPDGRLTKVGDFPSGGALTPDGRFYWAVDSGFGHDDVTIVSVASGKVAQVLPLPGGYGGIAFSPNGTRAYVS